MPSLYALLAVDVCLLAVLLLCTVLLLRRALTAGRAKRAQLNAQISTQAPVVAAVRRPLTEASILQAQGSLSDEAAASVFAPVYAVPPVRRPLFTDTLFEYDEEPVAAADVPVATVVAEVTGVPREHVGVLVLADDADLGAMELATVTEISWPAAKAEKLEESPAFEVCYYADPIDGTPFQPGEEVVPCACGSAYRLESAAWLRQEAGGECPLCDRPLGERTERIPADDRNVLPMRAIA